MGYIEYSEEADFSAKLLFTARRDELYLLRQDTLTEQIMNVILRLYGGIFADYTFIDEQLICSRVGTDRRTLYTVLTNLQNQGIVRYVPERKTPLITWTRQRVDTDKLRFDPEVYRLRKEEFKERIGAMTEYITRATGCRSAMLLKYFGETQEMHCMHCDLCQEKVSGHMTRGEKETITNAVTELLKEDGDPREVYSLPYPKKKIDIILHSLVNEGMIKIENGTVIYNNPD
jgi:ATP-dependent DNA helicase RecQ